jgi:hypothetical protein
VNDSEALGFDKESSKLELSGFAIDDMVFLESKALFQNPKSTSSSAVLLLQVVVGLLFGGLIWSDKSGCAGNSSIFYNQTSP